jgi:hypothetical protein
MYSNCAKIREIGKRNVKCNSPCECQTSELEGEENQWGSSMSPQFRLSHSESSLSRLEFLFQFIIMVRLAPQFRNGIAEKSLFRSKTFAKRWSNEMKLYLEKASPLFGPMGRIAELLSISTQRLVIFPTCNLSEFLFYLFSLP